MVNGNSVKFQVGKEAVYGTAVVPTDKLEISSEGFKYVANKTEEELLTGGIAGGLTETMSKKVEGSFSTLAKPTSVGYVLKGVLGKELVSEQDPESLKYTHTFTPIGNKESDKLPSYTFVIDRGLKNAFQYSGVVLNDLSFSASAEDRLKLDCNTIGKEESVGTVQDLPLATSERSFKFNGAKVYIDDVAVADITSITASYNNNCENFQTTDTGLFYSDPVQGKREIKADFETIYTDKIEEIRNTKFKEDDVIKVVVEFKDNKNNELKMTIENAQIETMDNATASGAETLKQQFSVKAVDIGSGDLIKFELKNDRPEEY